MNRYPDKLNAAVLFELNKPLKIINIDIPSLKRGQILVKVIYSSICRSQLMEQAGGRGEDRWLPHLLGHEGSGIVVGIGSGVKRFKLNDKVILTWIKTNGIESKPISYKYKNKVINAGKVTTFSNYSIVSENRLTKMPKTLDFARATLFGCALPNGAGMVLNQVRPNKDDSVVIIGFGGIGISAYMMLKALKIKNIIVIDKDKKKLKFAKELGVKNIYNGSDNYLIKKIINKTKGGASYCIESAGFAKTIELGFSLINNTKGKLYFASHPAQDENISINPHELIQGKQIFGTWGGSVNPDKDIKTINTMIKDKFDLMLFFSKIYDLKNINIALKDMKKNNVLRPLIKMHHD